MTDARRPSSRPFVAAPDDRDHPEYEQLVSLVNDRLDEVDREWIAGHLEGCEVCREDVDDLRQVRSSLTPQTPGAEPPTAAIAHERRWVKGAIGIAALAAGVALAIWIAGRESSRDAVAPTPVSQATASPAAPVLPPTPVATPATAPSAPVLSEEEQGRVARALASGRMEMPANIAVLRGHTGTLLGAGDNAPAFSPTAPVGTAVIEARPQFSWTAKPGATRYSVTIFDERFREVAKSGSLKTTTWTPSRDLPRGRVLEWQVTAVSRGQTAISPAPPNPEARFIVLDAAMVDRLAKERARLATEPIALGLVLAKAGLFAEADSVFQTALTDDRYDRSEVRALLARLRAR